MNTILSIIIPCFNSEATLEATLTSVYNQEYQNWEAIIVNDGSTDTTEKIANKWLEIDSRFQYFYKQNEGLGKTRNFAINKAIRFR
jgi:glycosyltransferase involved in cell wall biosynthesis